MKTFGVGSLAVALFVAFTAQGGDDAAQKKEQKALQGVWKIVSFEAPDGKKEEIVGATLEFEKDGKSVTFRHKDEAKKAAFKLNPAGKPKEIDISQGGESKTMEGIYQVDKKTLKICISNDANDGRPNEFAVKEGKKYTLVTLERAK